MGVFADWIHNFAPSWFQRPNMSTLLRSFGGELDVFSRRVFDGRRAAIPYAAGARAANGELLECDADTLGFHANDRGIRIYSSEPILSRRYRLSRWRQLKKRRGTHLGELDNLQPFWLAEETSQLPTMRIVHQDNEGSPSSVWYTLTSAGVVEVHREITSNWNYGGLASKKSRFWLIIYLPPGYSSAVTYDDGSTVYDGGAIYDGVTTLAIRDMVDAVKEAKSAHSRLAAIISTTLQPTDDIPGFPGRKPFDPKDTSIDLGDGTTSLPVGNWLYPVDPLTNLPTRPQWASWLYEDLT